MSSGSPRSRRIDNLDTSPGCHEIAIVAKLADNLFVGGRCAFSLEVVFNDTWFPIGFATLVAPPNPTRVAGNHAKNCTWTRTLCAESSSAYSNSRT